MTFPTTVPKMSAGYDHTPADRTGDDSQTHQKLFQQEEGGEAPAGEDFVS